MRTTDSRHAFPVAPNLLDRKFTASRPNQIWLADLTCIPMGEGWLHMAAIMDLHTRKVVGWSMRDHRAAIPRKWGGRPLTASMCQSAGC